jgi:succinate dehydrogenase / fumarate reductase, iron-sulfur subunit
MAWPAERSHVSACQLHIRFFKDGDSLTLEPWRAQAFPVVRDLVVDRSAFDRIIQAGGYITAPTAAQRTAQSIKESLHGGGVILAYSI